MDEVRALVYRVSFALDVDASGQLRHELGNATIHSKGDLEVNLIEHLRAKLPKLLDEDVSVTQLETLSGSLIVFLSIALNSALTTGAVLGGIRSFGEGVDFIRRLVQDITRDMMIANGMAGIPTQVTAMRASAAQSGRLTNAAPDSSGIERPAEPEAPSAPSRSGNYGSVAVAVFLMLVVVLAVAYVTYSNLDSADATISAKVADIEGHVSQAREDIARIEGRWEARDGTSGP